MHSFIVIGRVHYKPEHFIFWSNFEFDQNIVIGTRAWSSLRATFLVPCLRLSHCNWIVSLGTRRWNSWLPTSKNIRYGWTRMRGYQYSGPTKGRQATYPFKFTNKRTERVSIFIKPHACHSASYLHFFGRRIETMGLELWPDDYHWDHCISFERDPLKNQSLYWQPWNGQTEI